MSHKFLKISFLLILLMSCSIMDKIAATPLPDSSDNKLDYETLRSWILGDKGYLTAKWGDEDCTLWGSLEGCPVCGDCKHTGIDYGTSGKYENVYSVANGDVVGTVDNTGQICIYNKPANVTFCYLHLSSFEVTSGTVEQGDFIGKSGMTGAESTHLHFEAREGIRSHAACCFGNTINPLEAAISARTYVNSKTPDTPNAPTIGSPSSLPLLHTFLGHTDEVYCVAFSATGEILASGSNDGSVKFWQVSDGMLIGSHEDISYPQSIAFSPDGEILAVGMAESRVQLLQVTNFALLRELVWEGEDEPWSVAFSPDGTILASGGGIRLWQVSDGTLLHELGGLVVSLAFSPDGTLLAAGSYYGSEVSVWRITDMALLYTVKSGKYTGSAWTFVAFSPDGLTAASGARDGTIQLWRASDGLPLLTLSQPDEVTSITFSPDGKTLATGSSMGFIRVWQVVDEKMLHEFAAHTSWIRTISFSPDGKVLASGSIDHTVRLWQIP